MPSNIKEFDKQLQQFSTIIVPNSHSALVKKIAFLVLKGVVLKTPVDTGRARSNWLVTVNGQAQGTIEIDKLTAEQASNFALDKGIPVINNSKPFSTITITNNLPYIGVLEFGSSDQAPKGMLRVTISEIQSTFK